MINYAKSGTFYYKNVSDDTKDILGNIFGVHNQLNTRRYLGLPSLMDRQKRVIFNYIKERLWKKLQGWGSEKLSKARKDVLINMAAQVIASYCMTTFLLPSTLLDKLHIMLNKF